MFFSPLSIAVAFGMLLQGARGDTAEELANEMGFAVADKSHEESRAHIAKAAASLITSMKGIKNEPIVLKLANSMFVQQGFKVSVSTSL